MRVFTSESERDTEQIAAEIAAELRFGDVVALRGGLGAGKTAFVRGLARGLGLDDDVSSPTFALVHCYGTDRAGNPTLCHFDMYRISDYEGLYATGFFDYLDLGAILAVEWSENIETALPEGTITVELAHTGAAGESRRIRVEGGDRF